MSLNASFNKAKADIADAASRNLQHARPSAVPARIATPKLVEKRNHDTAFANPPSTTTTTTTTAGQAGGELLTHVVTAVRYLKEKDLRPVAFDDLIGYLSLPNDLQKNIPLIKLGLQANDRVEFIPKEESVNGKDCFRYRPLHPVTNGEELKDYLARQPTGRGVPAKDLKDGWPDCAPGIDQLEREGAILVSRAKDGQAKCVWADSPNYHILEPKTQMPRKADVDFLDFWAKTKLPANDMDLRAELERAGLTPTSQVKEVKRGDIKKKDKRRINRRGGKTTNSHMLGILKDYSNVRR